MPKIGPESIALTWTLLGIAIALLVGQALIGFMLGRGGVAELALALATTLLVASAVLNARASGILVERRHSEAESFGRLLQALSRSVSPGAVIEAIVHELGSATGADHVAVVQMRPGGAVLDVTFVSMLAGSQASKTVMPVRQLEPVEMRRLRTTPQQAGRRMSLDEPGLGRERSEASATGRGASASGRGAPSEPDSPAGAETPTHRGNAASGGRGRKGGRAAGSGAEDGRRPAGAGSQGDGSRSDESWVVRPPSSLAGIESLDDGDANAHDIADQIAYRLRDAYGLRNTLAAPLLDGGSIVGAIVLSRRTSVPWTDSTVRLLNSAAGETTAALSRVYSHQAAETEARTDQLTKLPNRRYFDEFCTLVASRRRTSDRVGILAVDVDHFKRLNDMYGHQVGDQVLKAIASAIQTSVRDEDLPARYGGEEFMVLLRNPTAGIALEVGERIRQTVRDTSLIDAGVTDRVTVSVGVACSQEADEPIAETVERADRALYAAKRTGRDRVVEAWPSEA